MPKYLWVVFLFLVGLLIGMGVYLFFESKAYSYLSNNSEACANCHVMQDHFRRYLGSSHRNVAQCNDCHSHAHFAGKFYVKLKNGFFHSLAFTTGIYREPIQITRANLEVAQNSCLFCHGNLFVEKNGLEQNCLICHKGVGH